MMAAVTSFALRLNIHGNKPEAHPAVSSLVDTRRYLAKLVEQTLTSGGHSIEVAAPFKRLLWLLEAPAELHKGAEVGLLVGSLQRPFHAVIMHLKSFWFFASNLLRALGLADRVVNLPWKRSSQSCCTRCGRTGMLRWIVRLVGGRAALSVPSCLVWQSTPSWWAP